MKTRIFLLAFLPFILLAVQPTITQTGDKPVKLLLDGDHTDQNAWSATGQNCKLHIAFKQPVKLANIILFTGQRRFAKMPSTEGSPKSFSVLGQRNQQPVKLHETPFAVPRDTLEEEEFSVGANLEPLEVDAIIIQFHELHDQGFRINSPNKAIVPPEKRVLYIREIQFTTLQQVQQYEAQGKLIDDCQQAPQNLARAIQTAWGHRLKILDNLLANKDYRNFEKYFNFLSEMIQPYLGAEIQLAPDGKGISLKLKPIGQLVKGQPASFPIHFKLLESIAQQKLSRTHAQLLQNGTTNINLSITPITPDRVTIHWIVGDEADFYELIFYSADQEIQEPALRRLAGNGDPLMQATIQSRHLPSNFWSVRFGDAFGDQVPALIAGRWTDFAHIYRNRGSLGKPDFSEFEHYLARDPFDMPIGTDKHHGLAFSVVEPTDADGDGKLDLFLARFYNTTPIFARNIAPNPGELEFDSPLVCSTLPRGYRYAFADLDKDGIADAIGVRLLKGKVEVAQFKGLGLSPKGTPQFDKPVPLQLDISDSTETSRGSSACTPSISLDDLDNDGDYDLTISVPPSVYIAKNNNGSFQQAVQIKTTDGTPFKNEFYYPNIGWGHIDGDGKPDLFLRTAHFAYPSTTSPEIVSPKRTVWQPLKKQLEVTDNYAGLANFQIADFDNDGNQELIQLQSYMYLALFKFKDGLFHRLENIRLEPPGCQRFGCPDNTEYHGAYAQIKLFDFDGDGKLDILTNTEHNWRFGYFSYYRNKGNNQFEQEVQLAPKPFLQHLETTKSPNGTAITIDQDSPLDFISFKTKDILDPNDGQITIRFAALDDSIPELGRTFFSSNFWDKKRFNHISLYESYRSAKTLDQFLQTQQPFALVQLPDGTIKCQLGNQAVQSQQPFQLKKDTWHEITLKWNNNGTTIELDSNTIATTPHKPTGFAERFHLGSMAWLAMQYAREYPARRKTHPTDFSTPINAKVDKLQIIAKNSTTLNLDFDQQFGTLKNRSALSYRCAPGVFKNFKGSKALVAHFDDHRRTQMPGMTATLYAVPFTTTIGKPPQFQPPAMLRHADGTPFHAHSRTVVVPYDWNNDGFEDILLSTENYPNPYHRGIELFINNKNWQFIRTEDQEILRLNELITAHHDVKLEFASLTGSPQPDLIVWTDPGIKCFSRPFLKLDPPKFNVKSIANHK